MVPRVLESDIVVLGDSEESLEDLTKVTEEEVSVDLVDNLHWELLKHILFRLVVNGLVLVINPLVVKVALNLLLQRDFEWYILVETSNKSKKSG